MHGDDSTDHDIMMADTINPEFIAKCLNVNQNFQKTPRIVSKTEDDLNANSPISYIYLTFNTRLPKPPQCKEGQSLSSTPNLKAFTNPKTWSQTRKYFILAMSCVATFLTAYSAGSYSPPSQLMAHDLGTSHLSILIGITTFCLGFGLVPMALAPISEIWGRYPVFAFSGVVLVVSQIACGLVTSLAGMLVARFFVGFGASAFSSVVGGVLADIWDKNDRNTPMAIFSGGVMAGTGAGPLIADVFVVLVNDGTLAWKWSFWHQAIADGLILLAFILFFRETRGTVLLSRKAAKLNTWYDELEHAGVYGVWVRDADTTEITQNSLLNNAMCLKRIRWKVQADEERDSLTTIISTSMRRPFYFLVTEPVVFSFALWASFAWGILYLAFAVVPYLHDDDFNASSRTYAAMIVGSAIATGVSIWQTDLLQHPEWRADCVSEHTNSKFWTFMRRKFPAEAPESRLYFACITGALLPAGLFGAFMSPSTGREGDGGTALAIGFGFATWGIYAIYLATFNYLADTYHIYAASTLAANSFCRNLLGGGFPLVTALMFDNMGLRGAGGLLAGLAAALTVIPWVLVFWGSSIRARSQMAIVSCILFNYFQANKGSYCKSEQKI